MSFDWWTLGFQTLNFLVLVWLLQRFLYRPVRRVIRQRRELAGRALAQAEEARQAAEAEAARLQAERQALAAEREQTLAQAHEEASAQRKAVQAEAEREAEARLAAGREALAAERQAALAALRMETLDLAGEMASRLLNGMAGPDGLAEAALGRILADLDALPEVERERLRHEAKPQPGEGPAAAAQLVTAMPLRPEVQAVWGERLGKSLGDALPPAFATDPAILGGAELRLRHTRMTFTLEDQLRRVRDALARTGLDNDVATP